MCVLIDAHCDTAYELYCRGEQLYENSLSVSVKKTADYASYTAFFAVWSNPECTAAFQMAEKIIAYFRNQLLENQIPLILSKKDLHRPTKGLRAFLTVEGGEVLEGKEENLQKLYHMGVRLLTLTWNGINEIGCGSLSGSDAGLTPFGKRIIRRMNKLGMIVDVSHLNEAGFYDAAGLSQKPMLASHSNASAVHPHPRNLSDEQFLRLKKNGGVACVNLYPEFVGGAGRMEDLLRHIEHFLELEGEDHVGIGTDFDGISATVAELPDASHLCFLARELTMRYGTTIAQKILFENVLRVMQANLQ